MWIYLGILSALFLGVYDLLKKKAVAENAVLPVLFLSTVAGLCVMGPVLALSELAPDMMREAGLFVPRLTMTAHAQIILKAVIVGSSWILAYFALKHLPISIVAPIRASAPLWTLLGAVLLFGERPQPMQWAGLATILISYYAFARLGKREGIEFRSNRWIWYIMLATLLGAGSALYDKHLLQGLGYGPVAVQAWFSFYLVVLLGVIVATLWLPKRESYTRFEWRWSIALVGVTLIAADFLYFRALHSPEALVSILSALRRSSVVISFVVGGMMFHEVNCRRKGAALLGVMAGVFMILFSD